MAIGSVAPNRQLWDILSITRAILRASDAAVELDLFNSKNIWFGGNKLCEFALKSLRHGEVLCLLWEFVSDNLKPNILTDCHRKALDIVLYGFYAKDKELKKLLLQRMGGVMNELIDAAADGDSLDASEPLRLQIAEGLIGSKAQLEHITSATKVKLDKIETLLNAYRTMQAKSAANLEMARRGIPTKPGSAGFNFSSASEDMDAVDGVSTRKARQKEIPVKNIKIAAIKSCAKPDIQGKKTPGTGVEKSIASSSVSVQNKSDRSNEKEGMTRLELLKKARAEKLSELKSKAAALSQAAEQATANQAKHGKETIDSSMEANNTRSHSKSSTEGLSLIKGAVGSTLTAAESPHEESKTEMLHEDPVGIPQELLSQPASNVGNPQRPSYAAVVQTGRTPQAPPDRSQQRSPLPPQPPQPAPPQEAIPANTYKNHSSSSTRVPKRKTIDDRRKKVESHISAPVSFPLPGSNDDNGLPNAGDTTTDGTTTSSSKRRNQAEDTANRLCEQALYEFSSPSAVTNTHIDVSRESSRAPMASATPQNSPIAQPAASHGSDTLMDSSTSHLDTEMQPANAFPNTTPPFPSFPWANDGNIYGYIVQDQGWQRPDSMPQESPKEKERTLMASATAALNPRATPYFIIPYGAPRAPILNQYSPHISIPRNVPVTNEDNSGTTSMEIDADLTKGSQKDGGSHVVEEEMEDAA